MALQHSGCSGKVASPSAQAVVEQIFLKLMKTRSLSDVPFVCLLPFVLISVTNLFKGKALGKKEGNVPGY